MGSALGYLGTNDLLSMNPRVNPDIPAAMVMAPNLNDKLQQHENSM